MPNKSIIYCRVSSQNQSSNISLQQQESECLKVVNAHGLKNVYTIKEIGSAYKQMPEMHFKMLKNTFNKHVIYFSVDRFSRNVELGINAAVNLIQRGCHLYFVRDRLIINYVPHRPDRLWNKFKEKLEFAQQESELISRRIKDAKTYAKGEGLFLGGCVPYGYDVKENKEGQKVLVPNKYEQYVIKFTQMSREIGTTLEELNDQLQDIHNCNFFEPLYLDNGQNTTDCKLTNPLTFTNIADILNNYRVKTSRYSHRWNSAQVNRISKLELDNNINNMLDTLSITNDVNDIIENDYEMINYNEDDDVVMIYN